MAPPCVATIFEGDNGGRTARGVSETEIRVGILVPRNDAFNTAAVEGIFEMVNQRFELYGRRLVPVFVAGAATTPVAARAYASDVAAQGVFASLLGAQESVWSDGQGALPPALPVALAREQIVTVGRGAATWWSDRVQYDPYHPYLWSVYPSSEDMQENLGAFACSTLSGHLARHAGDATLRSETRRFGIVALGQFATAPHTGVLAERLASCSGGVVPKMELPGTASPVDVGTGLERLRSDGATTLICVCEAFKTSSAFTAAQARGFSPEWIFTPTSGPSGNDEYWINTSWGGVVAPPMRLDAGPRLLPIQARPWYGALQGLFTKPPAGVAQWAVLSMAELYYSQVMVLASGIQGAGPQLTAQTFADALMTMQFPNPGAGQPPYWQGSAGFGPGDHAYYDDYNVGWWSDTAPALDTALSDRQFGSWCYLDQAARFDPGSYPRNGEERMFTDAVACR